MPYLLIDGEPVARDRGVYGGGRLEAQKFLFWCLGTLRACQALHWALGHNAMAPSRMVHRAAEEKRNG